MALPRIEPAPVVPEHAAVCRDVCEHPCQCRHVQHYVTGLMVLPNNSLANVARCLLDRADQTNLARLFAEAPWRAAEINRRRRRLMLQQTTPPRQRRRESLVVIEDTLCEHVGRLLDPVDRHDNHRDGPDPVAHNPVTSVSVSGPVHFPRGLRRDRRDEALTQWAADVAKHGPDLQIPPAPQARHRLHQQVAPGWRADPEFRMRQAPCRTQMALAIDLVAEALGRKVPCGVGVLDAWYRAADVVQVVARRRQDWISRRTINRRLDTASVHRREANGGALRRPRPHLAVAEWGPLIPAKA